MVKVRNKVRNIASMKKISTKDQKQELLSLTKELRSIEEKKKEIVDEVLVNLKKSVNDWSSVMSLKDFEHAILNLYTETFNKEHGTDYFAWNTKEIIQENFKNFVKTILKEKNKVFYDARLHRFFTLKKCYMKSTSRSFIEMEYYDINESDHLVYNYSGTAYHGFGSIDRNVQQKLTIDVEKLIVMSYEDSTKQYHSFSSSGKQINIDFISKLLVK